MSNWKLLEKETNLKTALIVLCQDYVIVDEEFMSNAKIKKNINNAKFWIDLADALFGAIKIYVCEKNGVDMEGYDDDEFCVSDDVILDFVMDANNRFELNDIICETVEKWLKHFGRRC